MPLLKKLFRILALPVLERLLSDADLKFVDVGGRGDAFPPLLPFAHLARYYVFEPEATEAARLEEAFAQEQTWRSVVVMAEAVGRSRGLASLYVTENPGMSSLLEPDPAVARRICAWRKFEVRSVLQVPVVPLDEAAERHGFLDASFLKLDTQGSELDILQGGTRVLESIVGIYTEAAFQPFYKGQPLFGDLDCFLRSQGFTLFLMDRTTLRRSRFRKTMYSGRMVTWAHCLYLREPETVAGGANPLHPLAGLLASSMAFHQYDVALEMTGAFEQAQLLGTPEVKELRREVRLCAASRMEFVVARTRRTSVETDLMSRSFRDKTYAD